MLQHFCTPGTARPSHPAPGCRARSYSDWLLNISTSFCQPCWTLLKVPDCRYCIGLNTFNKYFLSFEHFPCDTRNWDIQQKVRSWWLESELRDIVSRVTWTEWREWGCTLRYTDTLSSSSPAQRERSAQTRPLSFPDLGSNNNCLKNEIVDLIDTRIIDILT